MRSLPAMVLCGHHLRDLPFGPDPDCPFGQPASRGLIWTTLLFAAVLDQPDLSCRSGKRRLRRVPACPGWTAWRSFAAKAAVFFLYLAVLVIVVPASRSSSTGMEQACPMIVVPCSPNPVLPLGTLISSMAVNSRPATCSCRCFSCPLVVPLIAGHRSHHPTCWTQRAG